MFALNILSLFVKPMGVYPFCREVKQYFANSG